MIRRLQYLAKLSKFEKQSFVLDRLEVLYHRSTLITQMILDSVAITLLPASEEYITCQQEIEFLRLVSYEDIDSNGAESTNILESAEWYQKTIEVDILSASQLSRPAMLKEFTLEAEIKSDQEKYRACLFPQQGALPEKTQKVIEELEKKQQVQYWRGIGASILIIPEEESLENLSFYIDHIVRVTVLKQT